MSSVPVPAAAMMGWRWVVGAGWTVLQVISETATEIIITFGRFVDKCIHLLL